MRLGRELYLTRKEMLKKQLDVTTKALDNLLKEEYHVLENLRFK